MKKLLIILTALTLALSAVLFSACSKGGETANVSDSSVTAEESSSTSSANASRLPPSSRPQHSETPTESSTETDNSQSQSQGGTDSSGTDRPYVPGDPYYVDTVVVPDSVSNELWAYLSSLNSIGEINGSNYAEQLVKIENYLAKYETLSPEDKAYVTNIESLRQAREVCKEFERQGIVIIFNEKYAELPDAQQLKNRHVDLVKELAGYVNESYENYGYLAANVEDFAVKKERVQTCMQYVIDHTTQIATIAQDTNGNGILEDVILWTDGKNQKTETNRGAGAGMSMKKRSDYSSETLRNGIFQFDDKDISYFADDPTKAVYYSDYKNPTPVLIWYHYKKNVQFTAPNAGTLTVYFGKGQKRTYSITLDSAPLATFDTLSEFTEDSQVIQTFEIPKSGLVRVESSSSSVYIYALVFEYPELGD